jgi:hypothetical protein
MFERVDRIDLAHAETDGCQEMSNRPSFIPIQNKW